MKTETREECVGFEHAPWCAGPSMRECAGGAEVAEDQPCPGNDTAALGEAPRGEAPEADPGSAEYEDARTPVPADPRIAPFYDSADLDDDGVGDVCAWTGLHPDAPLPPVPEDAVPLCGDVPARFPENPGPYVLSLIHI